MSSSPHLRLSSSAPRSDALQPGHSRKSHAMRFSLAPTTSKQRLLVFLAASTSSASAASPKRPTSASPSGITKRQYPHLVLRARRREHRRQRLHEPPCACPNKNSHAPSELRLMWFCRLCHAKEDSATHCTKRSRTTWNEPEQASEHHRVLAPRSKRLLLGTDALRRCCSARRFGSSPRAAKQRDLPKAPARQVIQLQTCECARELPTRRPRCLLLRTLRHAEEATDDQRLTAPLPRRRHAGPSHYCCSGTGAPRTSAAQSNSSIKADSPMTLRACRKRFSSPFTMPRWHN